VSKYVLWSKIAQLGKSEQQQVLKYNNQLAQGYFDPLDANGKTKYIAKTVYLLGPFHLDIST